MAQDQDRIHAERFKLKMEHDFDAVYPAGMPVSPETRMAIAAEYAAYQLGQINRNLAALVEMEAAKQAK